MKIKSNILLLAAISLAIASFFGCGRSDNEGINIISYNYNLNDNTVRYDHNDLTYDVKLNNYIRVTNDTRRVYFPEEVVTAEPEAAAEPETEEAAEAEEAATEEEEKFYVLVGEPVVHDDGEMPGTFTLYIVNEEIYNGLKSLLDSATDEQPAEMTPEQLQQVLDSQVDGELRMEETDGETEGEEGKDEEEAAKAEEQKQPEQPEQPEQSNIPVEVDRG